LTKRLLAVVGLAVLGACDGDHAAVVRQSTVACDRACLEKLMDAVMTAMVAHDASRLPLATGFRYVENNQALKVGQGSWKTVQSFGPYRHTFADPESGNAAVIATLRENDEDGVFTLRIHATGGRLREAEAVISHDPQGAADYNRLGQPAGDWSETVAAEDRMSREDLQETANRYFGALEDNDGKGDYSFFADDCQRLEQGRSATRNPPRKGDHSVEGEFATLGCRGQFEMGFLGFITRIRDRRHEVIDVERGVVFSIAGFDLDGRTRDIPLTNGGDYHLPTYFSAARTLQVAAAFRIRDGRIDRIESTRHEFPYGMRTGFHATYDPSYEVPGGVAPDPRRACDEACLVRISDQLLAAMAASDPKKAPLADTLRYTENDQRLELYDGLWGTLTQVGANRLRVVEAQRGTVQVIVRTVESDLPGILSLRLRVRGDRITEIEAAIVREERGSAAALNRQRLPVEADPAGAATFDPQFVLTLPLGQRRSRLQLVALADRYLDSLARAKGGAVQFSDDCLRRDNGVLVTENPTLSAAPPADRERSDRSWGSDFDPYALDCATQLQSGFSAYIERIRDRRIVAVDVGRGLVASSAYYDIPGTVRAFTSPTGDSIALPRVLDRPYTLAVLQVLRIDGAAIQRIESVSLALPYGARPYWHDQ
jgi:hypothetical protein